MRVYVPSSGVNGMGGDAGCADVIPGRDTKSPPTSSHVQGGGGGGGGGWGSSLPPDESQRRPPGLADLIPSDTATGGYFQVKCV